MDLDKMAIKIQARISVDSVSAEEVRATLEDLAKASLHLDTSCAYVRPDSEESAINIRAKNESKSLVS